ncbi:conserved hypothetical protein [Thioalkalivibrio sulfidiphilus HL-EbGr7]|uniref:Uncharacterized protein n=1 Tax=Thioalkalivibrio sulfidiphilus (strain HL-EbGR7) TaxID=396588 RepID=B8GLB9_THISH|nr:hypothetical protein [Thioalkalivibrio sulfidiphilus]ACL71637.1 conserved hypothetical protein [Thioalkalivibrio sulfidiphilus HL-EbGr7]
MNLMRTLAAALLLLLLPLTAVGQEQRDLEGMAVIGTQELPKALHIVPWKRAEPGDPAPPPGQGLLGDSLAPLDRDVFLRELDYYETLRTQR